MGGGGGGGSKQFMYFIFFIFFPFFSCICSYLSLTMEIPTFVFHLKAPLPVAHKAKHVALCRYSKGGWVSVHGLGFVQGITAACCSNHIIIVVLYSTRILFYGFDSRLVSGGTESHVSPRASSHSACHLCLLHGSSGEL